jgi:hypothetical protein
MAKLPTRDDLGGLPAVRPTAGFSPPPLRPVRADGSAIGEAAAGLGKQIAHAGEVLYQQDLAAKEFEAERKFQEFKYGEELSLQEQMRAVEPGQADGFADRWAAGYKERARGLFAGLPEQVKPKYDLKLFDTERSLFRNSANFAREEQKRYSLNTLEDHKNRLSLSDDLDRSKADYDELIIKNPYLSPIEKDEVRRKHIDDIEEQHAERRIGRGDAVGIIKDLDVDAPKSGIRARLMQRESSGKPDAQNKLGYAGLYQFGAPRLADLGIYAPGEGEKVDSKERGGWSGNKWSGTFNIPGYPEVKTIDDFKANPEAQNAAFGRHMELTDAEIEKHGLSKYIGQKVGGVDITEDGLRAMIHLGGVGGAKKALESGGKVNPADDNGTSVLEYAKLGVPGKGEGEIRVADATGARLPKYVNLSPKRRQALLYKARQSLSYDMQDQIKSDRQMALETGEVPKGEDGLTTLQRAARYGILNDNQLRRAEIQIDNARLTHGAVTPLSNLTEADAISHIGTFAMNAKANGANAASIAAAERAAQTAQSKIKDLRNSDPVAAISGGKLPGSAPQMRVDMDGKVAVEDGTDNDLRFRPAQEVNEAWALIKAANEQQQNPSKLFTAIRTDPVKAREVMIEARLQAQARLMPGEDYKYRILSRDEAEKLLAMPKDVDPQGPDFVKYVKGAADRAEQVYGPAYAKRALHEAIAFKFKKTDEITAADGIAGRVIGQLTTGFDLTPTGIHQMRRDIERLRNMEEVDRVGRAFNGSGGYQGEVSGLTFGMERSPLSIVSPKAAFGADGSVITRGPSVNTDTLTGITGYAEEGARRGSGVVPDKTKSGPKPEDLEWAAQNPKARQKIYDERFGDGAFAREMKKRQNKQ